MTNMEFSVHLQQDSKVTARGTYFPCESGKRDPFSTVSLVVDNMEFTFFATADELIDLAVSLERAAHKARNDEAKAQQG